MSSIQIREFEKRIEDLRRIFLETLEEYRYDDIDTCIYAVKEMIREIKTLKDHELNERQKSDKSIIFHRASELHSIMIRESDKIMHQKDEGRLCDICEFGPGRCSRDCIAELFNEEP